MDNFKAKLASLTEDQQLSILLIGDSGLAGMWAESWKQSIAGILYDYFKAKYSATSYTLGALQPEATGLPKEWNYITLDGTWENWANIVYGAVSTSSAATVSKTFTGTGFKLYVFGWPHASTASVTIDGNAAGSFVTGSGTGGSGAWSSHVVYESPELTDGSHSVTINVNGNSGTAGMLLYAMEIIEGSGKGVRIHNLSMPGVLSESPMTTIGGTASTIPFLEAQLEPFNPDLVVVCYGYNDINNSRTPAQLQSNLTQIAEYIHGKNAETDLLFMSSCIMDPETNPSGTPQAEYMDAIQAVATANNAPFLNFASDWSDGFTLTPQQASDKYGYISSDLIHSNDAGHAEIARRLIETIDSAEPPAPTEMPLSFAVYGDTALPATGAPMTVYFKYGGEKGIYVTSPTGAVVKVADLST